MLELFKAIFSFLNQDILHIIDSDISFSIWDIVLFSLLFCIALDIIVFIIRKD